jgi:hypothetical protein
MQLFGDCIEPLEVKPACPQVLQPPPAAPPPRIDPLPEDFPFCVCDRALGSLPFALSDIVEQPDAGLGLRTYCFEVSRVQGWVGRPSRLACIDAVTAA